MPTDNPVAQQDDYRERRRTTTLEEILLCPTAADLQALRARRRSLARIYAEDGAILTARCIETVDIPLIEEALNAH